MEHLDTPLLPKILCYQACTLDLTNSVSTQSPSIFTSTSCTGTEGIFCHCFWIEFTSITWCYGLPKTIHLGPGNPSFGTSVAAPITQNLNLWALGKVLMLPLPHYGCFQSELFLCPVYQMVMLLNCASREHYPIAILQVFCFSIFPVLSDSSETSFTRVFFYIKKNPTALACGLEREIIEA